MKKITLIIALLSTVLLLEHCTKDTFTGFATSNYYLFATINDTTWATDTVNASITYTAATKTKTFTCTGTGTYKQLTFSVAINNSINTAGFPLNYIYNYGNNVNNVSMSYSTGKKNAMGQYVFTQQGTIAPGSASLEITAIDSVNKKLTGNFNITTTKSNYDSHGNFVSLTVNQILGGQFNNMPYTFVSK